MHLDDKINGSAPTLKDGTGFGSSNFREKAIAVRWRSSLLVARTLLGAPGLTTRNKKLLGAPGIATRSKDAIRNKGHRY